MSVMSTATPPDVAEPGCVRALSWLAPATTVVAVASVGQMFGARAAAVGLAALVTAAVAMTLSVGLAESRWSRAAPALAATAGVILLFGLWAQAARIDSAAHRAAVGQIASVSADSTPPPSFGSPSRSSAAPALSPTSAAGSPSSEQMTTPASAADLRGQALTGAILHGVMLRGADLAGANLSLLVLRGRDLRGADLSGATLRAADLRGADLSGATLRGADLSGACLRGARFDGADLFGADASGADTAGARVRSSQTAAALSWPSTPDPGACR